MLLVVTIDQRSSRRGPDLVEPLLVRLNGPSERGRLRAFERTAGDEVQGVLDDATAAVDLVLELVRKGGWSIGIGGGGTRGALPTSTRAGRGPAFENARAAVERAKVAAEGVAVAGPEPAARQAEAVLQLLAAVVARRTQPGWEAADLMAGGATQAQTADRLGISRQAVNQRLRAGLWLHEQRVRPVAARLLDEVSG